MRKVFIGVASLLCTFLLPITPSHAATTTCRALYIRFDSTRAAYAQVWTTGQNIVRVKYDTVQGFKADKMTIATNVTGGAWAARLVVGGSETSKDDVPTFFDNFSNFFIGSDNLYRLRVWDSGDSSQVLKEDTTVSSC